MTVNTFTTYADGSVVFTNRFNGSSSSGTYRAAHVSSFDEFPTRDPSRRKPKGVWLYPQPYERTVVRTTDCYGRIFRDYDYYETVLQNGVIQGVQFVDGSVPPEDFSQRDRTLIKALQKLKDQRINLGVALAEAGQTAELLGSTAARFSRSISAFRRRRWKQGLAELGVSAKKAPNNWLELQYAWKPLMSDVHGAFSELARAPTRDFRFSVTGITKEQSDEVFDIDQGGYLDSRQVRRTVQGHFCRLDFLPSNNFLSAISTVGATNPLEIVWEKVPFSFVADWFTTLGDSISVLDATVGYQFLSGSMTCRRERTVQVVPLHGSGVYGNGLKYNSAFKGSSRDFRLKRSPISELPRIIKPHFKNPVSLGHMANGLSLLTSVFSGSELLNKKFFR